MSVQFITNGEIDDLCDGEVYSIIQEGCQVGRIQRDTDGRWVAYDMEDNYILESSYQYRADLFAALRIELQ